ncbi:MAG: nucleotidyltransferase family protein [Prevotella sp.]|nr:nucleotidyltransferase family protein [Prevotella sp.]
MRKKENLLLFEFLQVAIGIRKSLSIAIDEGDWLRLFEFCKKQALIGVGFSAIEKLHALCVECPSNLRMKWMAMALQIEKKNSLLNEQCSQLSRKFEHDGLSTCILKGQGNCLNYPEGLRTRRMPGDIDVWATPIYGRQQEQLETTICLQADRGGERELSQIKRELKEICPQADGGIAIALQTGKEEVEYVEYHGHKAIREYVRMQYRLQGIDANPKACYHHIEAPSMDGTEVEVHYRPAFLRSPLRNWRMQRWFEHHADECMKNKTHLGFSMMTSSVNVVYQMCHLYTHIFEGGIGLRHLMDYYFALRVWHNDVMECKDLQTQGMWSEGLGTAVMSKEEVMAVLRSFGMGKFAAAVMWVLNEVFSMPKRQLMNDERLLITDGVHTENTDGNGGPQADIVGECELFAHCLLIAELIKLRKFFTHCQLKEVFIKLKQVLRIDRELKEMGPQADCFGERQLENENGPRRTRMDMDGGSQADFVGERKLKRINRELKENNFVPWMICEPNEKEGKKLLEEIMKGGNFGQYDERGKELKNGGMIKHGLWKTKRVMRLVRSYPEEALWEPVFRVYHLIWRTIHN